MRMVTRIPLLSNVKVAAPCHASWNLMTAIDGDRVRFCDDCKLNVYNLSAMTQAQAEGLLRAHEGRLCVRYYERPDGTILTRNCPVGAQVLRVKMIQHSVSAAFVLLLGAFCYAAAELIPLRPEPVMGKRVAVPQAAKPLVAPVEVKPQPVAPLQGEVFMGKVASHPVTMGHARRRWIEDGANDTTVLVVPQRP
jgi:hypothetical protein